MKRIGCLKIICVVVILSCSHLVLAQDNWAGQAQCQVNFQIDGYAHREIQTWTVTGPQLPNQKDVYPATWSVVSQGATQRAVGPQNLAAQWNSNVAPMSAPLRIGVRPSDNRLLIKSFHAQMVSRAATQGVRQVAAAGVAPAKSSIASDAYEWQFPLIEDSSTTNDVTGTGTISIAGTYMPLAPSGSNGVANCTWHFTKGAGALADGAGTAKGKGASADRGSSAGQGGGAAGAGVAGGAGAGASASAGGADASGKAGAGGGAASGGNAGAAGGAGAGASASAGGAASGGKAGAAGGAASGGSAGAAGGAGAGASASAGGAASGGKAGAAGGAASGGAAGAGSGASAQGSSAGGAAGAGAGAQGSSAAAGAGVSTQSSSAGGQVAATGTSKPLQSSPKLKSISATAAQITQINPSSAGPNQQNIQVTLTGKGTHFVQGQTTASFASEVAIMAALSKTADSASQSQQAVADLLAGGGSGGSTHDGSSGDAGSSPSVSVPPQLQVVSVNVVSSTSAVATVNIDPAARGAYVVSLTTGSEVAILQDRFNVGRTVSVAPASVSVAAAPEGSGAITTTATALPGSAKALSPEPTQTTISKTSTKIASLPTPPTITLDSPLVPCNMVVDFFINGVSTHFVQGSTRVDFGPKIQVLDTRVLQPNNSRIDAHVFIAADAPAKHTVTVTTGSEVATVSDPLIVTQPCETTANRSIPSGMTPSSIPQGTQNVSVNIGTVLTNGFREFDPTNLGLIQGVTRADFGEGITVVSLTVTSTGSATAVINIARDAPAKSHTLTLTTASIAATAPFSITAGGKPQITMDGSLARCNMVVDFIINGVSTHFIQGSTRVDFGPKIEVLGTTVLQPNNSRIAAHVFIATDAPAKHIVSATTGSEVATVADPLIVAQPCEPADSRTILNGMTPSSIPQGTQNVSVNIGTVLTNDFRENSLAGLGLNQGVTRADFGEGITVVSLTVTSAGSATAVINIAPDAPAKNHTLTLTTASIVATAPFSITAGGKPQITMDSSKVPCNMVVDFFINGVSTHFIQGSTRVDFGPKIEVLGTTVLQPNNSRIDAYVFIAADAPAKHVVTVTTGSEVATVSDSLIVTQPCEAGDSRAIPNGMTPSSIPQGTQDATVNIGTVVTNDFRGFSPASLGLIQGVTRADFGEGITVVSLTVTSTGSATAVINIAPDAPAGARTVTVTTASIVRTTPFTVDRAQP